MKKILSTLAIAALVFNFTSCVVDDRKMDNNETGIVTYELTATKTVQNIKAFNNTSAPLQYTADDIIEAYVTSSDETGTFYNTICMQDIAVNTAQKTYCRRLLCGLGQYGKYQPTFENAPARTRTKLGTIPKF